MNDELLNYKVSEDTDYTGNVAVIIISSIKVKQ